jgi:ubiquinone/menaquinone biosynthesis C-methylase UbiE
MSYWDRFSEDYDRIFLENPLYVDTIERMMFLARQADGSRVLDLGCGTGNVTGSLLKSPAGAGACVVGVDPSEGMRARYAGRFEGNESVEVREGDALSITAGEQGFDIVMSHLVLHHVEPDDRGRCAAELARVLASGGMLIYADMFCDVDSDPRDPVRAKDIVDKMVGVALYCLDHGAFDMMQVMLATLPMDVSSEGEYLTTASVWKSVLEDAGLIDVVITDVPPEQFGVKIITARKP